MFDLYVTLLLSEPEIKRLFVCLITETSHGLASDGQVVYLDFSCMFKLISCT